MVEGYGTSVGGYRFLSPPSGRHRAGAVFVTTKDLESHVAHNFNTDPIVKNLYQTWCNIKKDIDLYADVAHSRNFDKGLMDDMQNIIEVAFRRLQRKFEGGPRHPKYGKPNYEESFFKVLQDMYESAKKKRP